MNEEIKNLLLALVSGNEEEVWRAALRLEELAFAGLPEAAYLQLRGLLVSEIPVVSRAAAAYVLGFARDAASREILELMLADASLDSTLRGHVAEALGYIADPLSQKPLIANLADASAEVRYWTIFALGQLGDAAALSALRIIVDNDVEECEGRQLADEAREAIANIEGRATPTIQ